MVSIIKEVKKNKETGELYFKFTKKELELLGLKVGDKLKYKEQEGEVILEKERE